MLSAADVENLSYVELLARLSESNRPPGGVESIARMAAMSHLRPGTKVLHAGCNAGFLSRELARRTGCSITGIDINPNMVWAASARASVEGLEHLLDYRASDMRALPFPDGSFDVVLSGGALAFVDSDRQRAIDEWMRVTKPHGLIADCELFYRLDPPHPLLREISSVIGVEIPKYDLQYWEDLFTKPRLETYYRSVSEGDISKTDAQVNDYVSRMMVRYQTLIEKDAAVVLERRLRHTFSLFNENMRYLGCVLFVKIVRPEDFEPALFV